MNYRRIFLVTYPDGETVAFSSLNMLFNGLVDLDIHDRLEIAEQFRKPNKFEKVEFKRKVYLHEKSGFKVETVPFIT